MQKLKLKITDFEGDFIADKEKENKWFIKGILKLSICSSNVSPLENIISSASAISNPPKAKLTDSIVPITSDVTLPGLP
jgi:hypothetical protein